MEIILYIQITEKLIIIGLERWLYHEKTYYIYSIFLTISGCTKELSEEEQIKQNTMNNIVVYDDGTHQELLIYIDYVRFATLLEEVDEKDIDRIEILGKIKKKVITADYFDTDCANFDAVVGQNYGKLDDEYVAYWYDTWYKIYSISSFIFEVRIDDHLYNYFGEKCEENADIEELGTITKVYDNACHPLEVNDSSNITIALNAPYGKSGDDYVIYLEDHWRYLEDSGSYFDKQNNYHYD